MRWATGRRHHLHLMAIDLGRCARARRGSAQPRGSRRTSLAHAEPSAFSALRVEPEDPVVRIGPGSPNLDDQPSGGARHELRGPAADPDAGRSPADSRGRERHQLPRGPRSARRPGASRLPRVRAASGRPPPARGRRVEATWIRARIAIRASPDRKATPGANGVRRSDPRATRARAPRWPPASAHVLAGGRSWPGGARRFGAPGLVV